MRPERFGDVRESAISLSFTGLSKLPVFEPDAVVNCSSPVGMTSGAKYQPPPQSVISHVHGTVCSKWQGIACESTSSKDSALEDTTMPACANEDSSMLTVPASAE